MAVLSASRSMGQETKPAEGISIGQQVPDVTITNIHNYKTTTAKISDFRGKLLILDFWATWCAPCLSMIPKIDSLQAAFEGKIEFVSITRESTGLVHSFFTRYEKLRKASNIPIVSADTTLHKLFRPTALPHYVWVDKSGVVRATTGMDKITGDNIRDMLSKRPPALGEVKINQIAYDRSEPLFDVNSSKRPLHYQSTLSAYIKGVKGGTFNNIWDSNDSISVRRITAVNTSIRNLYQLASCKTGNLISSDRTVLNVKNPDRITTTLFGDEYLEWLENGHGYCYELIVPKGQQNLAFDWMWSDLERLFPQYRASIELRDTVCLVLKRTSNAEKFKSSGGKSEIEFDKLGCRMTNCTLNVFVKRLDIYSSIKLPMYNETGYTDRADLAFDADLTNLESINQALAAYDLTLVKSTRPVQLLVIRDAK